MGRGDLASRISENPNYWTLPTTKIILRRRRRPPRYFSRPPPTHLHHIKRSSSNLLPKLGFQRWNDLRRIR
eukprot:scaffold15988_cov73-Skeletonema_dohrnii-CCMP3373.AAC.2